MSLRLPFLAVVVVVATAALCRTTTAFSNTFVVTPGATVITKPSTTAVFAKVKRGKLGQNVVSSETIVAPNSRPRKKKPTTVPKKVEKKKKKGENGDAAISPGLAQWMASQAETNDNTMDDDEPSTAATTFTPFEEPKASSSRRTRQSSRLATEQARSEETQQFVARLERILGIEDEENKSKSKLNVNDLLTTLGQLRAAQPSSNTLQSMAAGKSTRYDYRLAWVGSDDAVCHVGSALHKVPLARLQEVFLSLPGRNQVVLQEVIRILGPFPNVKNTLEGSSENQQQGDGVMDWKVTWESMVDGTGKEVLAGKAENVRRVDLKVYFADPSILVAVVPDKEKLEDDPFKDSGKNVLLFLREDDLDGRLESLRVG
jgi:hypothetical protein